MLNTVSEFKQNLSLKARKSLDVAINLSYTSLDEHHQTHIEKVCQADSDPYFVCCSGSGNREQVYLAGGVKLKKVEFQERVKPLVMELAFSEEDIRQGYSERNRNYFIKLHNALEHEKNVPADLGELVAAYAR
jgi:hypothetical protein